MRYSLLSLILIAGAVYSETAETFRCKSGSVWLDSREVVVIATINKDGETGTIQVAGVTHEARYRVEGFDRRWDFERQSDLSYDYAFVLTPSGVARYYDFSGTEAGETVRSSAVFSCR